MRGNVTLQIGHLAALRYIRDTRIIPDANLPRRRRNGGNATRRRRYVGPKTAIDANEPNSGGARSQNIIILILEGGGTRKGDSRNRKQCYFASKNRPFFFR